MTFPVGEATIYYYAPFIWSNGGDLVSGDGLTVDGYFNSERNAETMRYFRGLADKKYMSAVPIENLFESGRAAFKFDGAWEVNTVYTSYPDIELGVAPYVVGDNWDGSRYTPTGSWAYAASSVTENIEGATELVKWMSGVESGLDLYEQTKSLPSTYAAYGQISDFTADENYKALYEQLRDYGHPRPNGIEKSHFCDKEKVYGYYGFGGYYHQHHNDKQPFVRKGEFYLCKRVPRKTVYNNAEDYQHRRVEKSVEHITLKARVRNY